MNRRIPTAALLFVLAASASLVATGCMPHMAVGGSFSTSHYGGASKTDIYVYGPPPAPIYEHRTIAPGPGHLWIDGYWDWTGAGWTWLGGAWLVVSPGYNYVRPHCTAIDGRWVYQRGYFHDGSHRYYRQDATASATGQNWQHGRTLAPAQAPTQSWQGGPPAPARGNSYGQTWQGGAPTQSGQGSPPPSWQGNQQSGWQGTAPTSSPSPAPAQAPSTWNGTAQPDGESPSFRRGVSGRRDLPEAAAPAAPVAPPAPPPPSTDDSGFKRGITPTTEQTSPIPNEQRPSAPSFRRRGGQSAPPQPPDPQDNG